MHSVATFQRVRGLSAQQPQVATRRRGSSILLSGKTCTAGRSPIQVRTNWTAPTRSKANQARTHRNAPTGTIPTTIEKHRFTVSYGLSRYEAGFFFILPVGGLQQKYNNF